MKAGRLMVLLRALMIVTSSSVFAETRPRHLNNGQKLYRQHCFKYHGARLDGKGPDSWSLSVRPTDLYTYLARVKSDLELEVTI